MIPGLARFRRTIGGISATLSTSACRWFTPAPGTDPTLAPAWKDWERGDFLSASGRAAELVAGAATADAGHHMLALVSHVTGKYSDALAHYGKIGPNYRWLKQLDEPMLWSYVHLRDIEGAQAFGIKRSYGKRSATAVCLKLAAERPMSVQSRGLVEIELTVDGLTPYMPGFSACLNGRPTVARLDTGGSFVHLSSEQAAAYGIKTVACERTFAGLNWGKVCHGVTDLGFGSIQLENVPILVHDGQLAAAQIANAFGVELGPIVGTNVLEQFMSTVDGTKRRLYFSRRGDGTARDEHLRYLGNEAIEVPFVMWGDHYMIARGSVGEYSDLNLFVDSGLVALTENQGQAALLASDATLTSWGVSSVEATQLADLPGSVGLGAAVRRKMSAMRVSDATWRDFGDWGGIRVDALISWGFLKHFVWTVDFDRRVFLLRQQNPAANPADGSSLDTST
jgi:hypothetical protein